MKAFIPAALCASVALFAVGTASAHFILVAPDSWITANALGDPQKAAPCGTSEKTKGVETGKVTAIAGGEKIHIKIKETIYHPGFYRVALSVLDRAELPADPIPTTRMNAQGKPISVSGKIESNPQMPVLADGLFLHHEKPAPDSFYEADIKVPNINCDKCTLQVIQFMEAHGLNPEGEFTYHHCATIKITANPALPIDKGWPGQPQ